MGCRAGEGPSMRRHFGSVRDRWGEGPVKGEEFREYETPHVHGILEGQSRAAAERPQHTPGLCGAWWRCGWTACRCVQTCLDCVQTCADVFGLCADVFGLRADVFGLCADVFGLCVDVFGLCADVFGLWRL